MRADLIVSRTRCSASSALLRRAGTTRGQIRWTPGEENSAAGYQLPGPPGRSRCKKTSFYWAFHHGMAFADPSAVNAKGRAMGHLSEFCHAACSWRRVVGTGCPPVTDLVEIGLSAIDRLQAEFDEPLRFLW